MKRNKLSVLILLVAVMLCSSILVGCAAEAKPLWNVDFTYGNNSMFITYGSVQDNDDGTITLKREGDQNYSANTYFGQNTKKNYEWIEGGMSVQFKVKVDDEALTNGKYSVWSLALNGQNGAYLTELPVFFIGTEDGVKFTYDFTGVDSDYVALAASEDAVSIDSGFYTVCYNFTTQENGEVKISVVLLNDNGNNVKTYEAETFTVIDNAGVAAGTVVKEEMIKGLRYLWLVRTTVDVVVDNLAIYSI